MTALQTTDSTVLITGESGTGKEVVARNVHYRSKRRDRPFVPINCAAIPSELIESELFGHEKGAFTGATATRKGRFEMAQGGTLFLDEVGDMPLNAQTKLLRVIQERTFERLGGNRSFSADVRIVAATHCDLEQRIEDRRFRHDLFYRLNVFPIEMPPLRDRGSDIPLLIDELRRRIRSDLDLEVEFSAGAVRKMQQGRWKGNVRELANLVERLAIMFPHGKVRARDLPQNFNIIPGQNYADSASETPDITTGDDDYTAALTLPPEGLNLKQELLHLERDAIRQALRCSDGVVAHAARLLRMRRTTLVEKMQRFSIDATSNATTAESRRRSLTNDEPEPHMTKSHKQYLTPNEVAELLMVSPVTVRQWAQKGEITAMTTPGGHRRFLHDDLLRFAEQRGLTLKIPGGSSTRILVVEDDVAFAGYLVELLTTATAALDVELANDGFEAGRKVQTFLPHVVLLDLMMPGLDGFDVCRRLKSDPSTRASRVVAMTGFWSPENELRILSAGAEVCLAKPFDKERLFRAVGLQFDSSGESRDV